jgi:hypothetical protein
VLEHVISRKYPGRDSGSRRLEACWGMVGAAILSKESKGCPVTLRGALDRRLEMGVGQVGGAPRGFAVGRTRVVA